MYVIEFEILILMLIGVLLCVFYNALLASIPIESSHLRTETHFQIFVVSLDSQK